MPPQTPQDSNNNSYDFFLNPPAPPKPKLIPRLNSSRQKTFIFLVGGCLLLLLAIVLISVLFGGKNPTGLLTLAQQQNELIRVSTEGLADATQQTTKNVAINIELGLTTDQKQLLAFMGKHGQGASTAQLSSTKNTATDQQLQSAIIASDVDSVYLQIMQTSLGTYKRDIKQIFNSSNNSSERQMLNNEYESASLLASQINSAIQALQD